MPLRLTGLGTNAVDEDAYRDDLRFDSRNESPVMTHKRNLGTCKDCGTFADLVKDDAVCRDCEDQIEENSRKAD